MFFLFLLNLFVSVHKKFLCETSCYLFFLVLFKACTNPAMLAGDFFSLFLFLPTSHLSFSINNAFLGVLKQRVNMHNTLFLLYLLRVSSILILISSIISIFSLFLFTYWNDLNLIVEAIICFVSSEYRIERIP